MTDLELKKLKLFSAEIRLETLKLVRWRGYGHLGGALSIVELLSVLYKKELRHDPQNPQMAGRDYLVLSKGHAGPSLYCTLALREYFPHDMLYTMNEGGTSLPSHPDRLRTPGIDATTGSLGQGTSVAAGMGYGLRQSGSDSRVFLIVGDGELNEGQCWEAFQFLAHHKLNNVIVFIDENKRQLDGYTTEILTPFSTAEKMRAFGFHTQYVKGNDEQAIFEAIEAAKSVKDSAVCIVLDTIKGQGVPFFEELRENHAVKCNDTVNAAMDAAISELEQFVKEGRE
ncbi:MAG: transketolase [Angelakisella sp.]